MSDVEALTGKKRSEETCARPPDFAGEEVVGGGVGDLGFCR